MNFLFTQTAESLTLKFDQGFRIGAAKITGLLTLHNTCMIFFQIFLLPQPGTRLDWVVGVM